MKKTKYYAWMMAAALAMTGCSDEIETGGENGGATIDGETGYIKVALNLPSTSGMSTRAANDDFNDGVAGEYNISNAILALFYDTEQSQGEANATCQWATNLTDHSFELHGTTIDNITSKFILEVQKVPKPAANVYAFVILNNNGYFEVSGDKLQYSKEANSTNKTDFTGDIADLYAKGAESSISNLTNSIARADNFMMTNAPISDKASLASGTSWDPNISTLVRLKVYDDQATAEDATADNIYVERVVAKATVKVSNDTENDYTLNVTNDAYPNAVVDFTNWKLQNTNKKTYLVRNVGTGEQAAWKQWIGYYNISATKTVNRFVGETSDPYRTYWGIDPNYKTVEDTNLENNFNIWTATNTDAEIDWNDVANNKTTTPDAEYCLENTCEANAMNKNQLTSVLLKATFYVNGKPSAGDDAESFFTVNNISEIYTKDGMLQALTVCLANSETEGVPLGENESLQLKSTESGKNITSSTDLKAVFEVKTANGVSELSDDQANAILTSYNPIKYFKDGVTFYYTSLIEHFGETYTPVTESSTGSYTYNDNDHLGYFGVLRNNWYELNITEVSGPGEPEIPEIPEDPGHTEYYFVKAAVNVLSWARRAQSVEL